MRDRTRASGGFIRPYLETISRSLFGERTRHAQRLINMERIIHPNDNAREAKAAIWFFEGSSLYVLIAAFALALAAFRYCYDGLGLGTWGSVVAGAAPLVAAMVYVLTLKLGKPKSYDIDFFRSSGVRLIRVVAGTGLALVRFELHGLGTHKTRHPYAE